MSATPARPDGPGAAAAPTKKGSVSGTARGGKEKAHQNAFTTILFSPAGRRGEQIKKVAGWPAGGGKCRRPAGCCNA
ncbi:MAG: hypothetical protein ABL872_09930 [Lacibacter sp.]